MKYIIMKRSRSFENPSVFFAYRGPACEGAGVEPGKVYENKAEAEIDAEKLTDYNPIGFQVLVCRDT